MNKTVVQPSSLAVLDELARILVSRFFKTSPRMSALLKYITEQTLAGNSARLKQYTLALDVFERAENFDPIIDPIVRMQASKLRKTLESYYLSEGTNNEVIIRLPKGGYIPLFELNSKLSDASSFAPQDVQKPVLAILPFVGQGEDLENSFFTDSLQEELNIALSKFENLSLVSPLTMCQQHFTELDLQTVGRQLGARYVVSGTVRSLNQHLRLVVSLSDTNNGRQVWTERFERQFNAQSLFELQDELVSNIAGRIGSSYGAVQLKRFGEVKHKQAGELSSYEAQLHYLDYLTKMTSERHAETMVAMERVVQQEPDNVQALAVLSQLHIDAYMLGLVSLEQAVERANAFFDRAMSEDPRCQQVQLAGEWLSLFKKDRPAMRESAAQVLELNPYASYMVCTAGWCLCLGGDFEQGISMLNTGLRQQGYYPSWLHMAYALQAVEHEDYAAAMKAINKFCCEANFWQPFIRALIYMGAGQQKQAMLFWLEAVSLNPNLMQSAAGFLENCILQESLRNKLQAQLSQILSQC